MVENEAEERKQIGSYIVEYFQEKAILQIYNIIKTGKKLLRQQGKHLMSFLWILICKGLMV